MTDKKLTWAQKDARREARRHGETVAYAVRAMEQANHEADMWQRFGEDDGHSYRFWAKKADGFQNKAIEAAVKAAHEAAKSLK